MWYPCDLLALWPLVDHEWSDTLIPTDSTGLALVEPFGKPPRGKTGGSADSQADSVLCTLHIAIWTWGSSRDTCSLEGKEVGEEIGAEAEAGLGRRRYPLSWAAPEAGQ